jgi:DNA-binding transcriptional regulator YdaS (Cro superfamily)
VGRKKLPIRIWVLRVELARRNMSRQALAQRLDVSPSTLSGWLRGVYPTPANLSERIERALKIKRGRLVPRERKAPPQEGGQS